ncbi:MAG: ExeM/NucH family extracellular endonuclease [Ilumatobacteraceae bacterium]
MTIRSRSLGRVALAASILGVVVVADLAPNVVAADDGVFISELHYDNDGADIGEAVEVTGPSGTDLTGWSIVLYNGSNGQTYDSVSLDGILSGDAGGEGASSFDRAGIQNGAPDGLALVDPDGAVVEFLSYEGSFDAVGGPADGLTSTDIGVAETGSTPVGDSLQLIDGAWTGPAGNTFGTVNGESDPDPDPDPVAAVINEFSYSTAGEDIEYVEVIGAALTDLSALSVVVIDGDDGSIEIGATAGTTDANGLWLLDLAANTISQGSVSVLLVDGWSGGADPLAGDFGTIVDTVAVSDGDAGDTLFGDTVLTDGYDGLAFAPGGASRIPDGVDTDMTADWVRNDFDKAGIDGFPGSLVMGEALNTPGTPNSMTVAPTLYISELHYDNAGGDVDEGVEISGTAGADLTGWTVVLYNGSNNSIYGTVTLDGTVDDEGAGLGARWFPYTGIQNGNPDALALVDPSGTVIEFLSYGGTIVAMGGPASGTESVDIGVSESGSTPLGQSLQLVDGTWTGPAANSFDVLNVGAVAPVDSCPDLPALTAIGQAQGAGDASPCVGELVAIEGIVVGDYEGASPALRGFYVQSADGNTDGDPATSDGIFVFNADDDEVALGDAVHIEGAVAEFQGQTQISNSTITVLSSGNTVTPAAVSLPVSSPDDFEAVEGMLVTFDQELVVTELYLMGRSGEVRVSSGTRLDQPTAVVEPGPDSIALQAANDLDVLIIDDPLQSENPDPYIFGPGDSAITAANPLRGGDSTTGATGVMTYTWAGYVGSDNAYRLRPAGDPIVFDSVNPRPSGPPSVGGTLKVVGFNVLNYFLTLDDGGANCGPDGAKQDCRGAETAQEYERQHAKLIAALLDIDADVYGFAELENTTGVDPLAPIVSDLNAAAGADVWSSVDTGTVGTDTIRVGMIYRNDVVGVVGTPAVLDNSVDPTFDDDRNRPSLAVSIEELASGAQMTVALNHWKSKGSCPSGTGPDADAGDGAGCWNATRAAAAGALVDWLATHPTGIADDDVLVFGDLNSYAQEDPIDVLRAAGYVDEVQRFTPGAHSYVFDGQWGTLDYAFASPSLDAQITGAADYHINSDEPPVLDYNTNFKTPAQIVDLYAPDRFRTSDHDPALVGIALDPIAAPTADCAVDYRIHAVWPGGFIAQIWIENTGDVPINGWDLGWTFEAGERVLFGWSGRYRQSGAEVSVHNVPWNRMIAPGGRTTIGFIGRRGAAWPVAPDEFTLDGLTCGG